MTRISPKFLIKSTNEVRIENKQEIEEFRQELEEDAKTYGCTLTNFSWNEKTVKEKGEIVDYYYQVKYTFSFNSLAEPNRAYTTINYED